METHQKNLVTRKSQAVHPEEYDDCRLRSAKNTAAQLSGVDESGLKLLHKDVPKREFSEGKAAGFAHGEANS